MDTWRGLRTDDQQNVDAQMPGSAKVLMSRKGAKATDVRSRLESETVVWLGSGMCW